MRESLCAKKQPFRASLKLARCCVCLHCICHVDKGLGWCATAGTERRDKVLLESVILNPKFLLLFFFLRWAAAEKKRRESKENDEKKKEKKEKKTAPTPAASRKMRVKLENSNYQRKTFSTIQATVAACLSRL